MDKYTFTDDGEVAHVLKNGGSMTAEEIVQELRDNQNSQCCMPDGWQEVVRGLMVECGKNFSNSDTWARHTAGKALLSDTQDKE